MTKTTEATSARKLFQKVLVNKRLVDDASPNKTVHIGIIMSVVLSLSTNLFKVFFNGSSVTFNRRLVLFFCRVGFIDKDDVMLKS